MDITNPGRSESAINQNKIEQDLSNFRCALCGENIFSCHKKPFWYYKYKDKGTLYVCVKCGTVNLPYTEYMKSLQAELSSADNNKTKKYIYNEEVEPEESDLGYDYPF